MPPVAPPPNPSLVAIVLIVRSRDGSRFVFHYPEKPQTAPSASKKSRTDSANASDSSDSDDDGDRSSTSEDDTSRDRDSTSRKWLGDNDSLGSAPAKRSTQRPDDEDETPTPERKDSDGTDGWRAPWESFLGLRTRALSGLLAPGSRTWHKRRFEVGLNDLCFIGWPVFVREDGAWQKKKHKRERKVEQSLNGESKSQEYTSADREDGLSESTKVEETSGQDETHEKSSNMTMFNVVFVLNPPVLEYSLRVKEMYDNIVKKFGKALKFEQARIGYVWKEAKVMLKLKEKAREKHTPTSSLYKDILEQSSLARAIATIFNSISDSRIAGPLTLTSTQISLQIPPTTSISLLPSLTDPPCLPGLWLTTADSANDEHLASVHVHSSTSLYLAKHFGLLLLDNESTILKDITASAGPLAPQLAHYIRSSPPTKSFAKVSALASISLNDIQQLANHLVYWRRARAVPPLHQRDTYVVSPNANIDKLALACTAYEITFPTLPSLPKMLSALSGTPRPYRTLIPSKDHKEAYFQILAWLLRGGWVTQLRTFAWVRVDKEIKIAVDKATREERKKEKEREKAAISNDRKNSNNSLGKDNDSANGSSFGDSSLPSSQDRPSISSRSFSGSQSSSIPTQHSHQSHSPTPPNDLNSSSLILNPSRASPLESAYLTHITNHLIPEISTTFTSSSASTSDTTNLSPEDIAELKHYFPIFARGMDGIEALEKIPIKEGMKRQRAWDILGKLGVFARDTSVDDEGDADGDAGGENGEGAGRVGQVDRRKRKTVVVVGVRHW